jgi:hypothetical protein
LIAGMVWLGLYPQPVLRRMEAASQHYVDMLQPVLDQARTPAPDVHAEANR